MNFNKLVALALSIILLLSLLAGCSIANDESSSSIPSENLNSSTVYDNVDIIEDEIDDTQSVDDTLSSVDQESSSDNSSDNSSDTSSITMPDNIVDVGGNDPEDEDLPPTYIEPTPETPSTDTSSGPVTKPTYTTSPNANGKMKTVEIEAGQSVYYKIKGASNRIFTINSPNAYVIYNGVTYSAKNGVLSFFVESNELASAQILFEIGNKGSQKEFYTIQFTSELGSKDNPEVFNSIDQKISAKLKEGNDQGYSYSYVATKSGKIRFYILSDESVGKITVDKIINAKLLVVQQRSTTDAGEDYYKKDSVGTYIEFDVASGDKFTITAAHNSDSDYSAITIEWKAIYA